MGPTFRPPTDLFKGDVLEKVNNKYLETQNITETVKYTQAALMGSYNNIRSIKNYDTKNTHKSINKVVCKPKCKGM